jgi:hypothetical protein
MGAELMRRSLFPNGSNRDQDELVWSVANDLAVAHMTRSLTSRQLGDLALAWKGASGKLGWAAVEHSLDPSLRGRCAYLLGFRYLQLQQRETALRLFTAARDAAPAGSALSRLAEAECSRLQ